LRAINAIDRQIGVIREEDLASEPIAAFFFAVAGNLILERRVGSGEVVAAHACIAHARDAFRVHARTVVARYALDARAGMTERSAVLRTWGQFWNVRMRRHATIAYFGRADIAVIDGEIRVVVDRRGCARAIADDGLAIARGLSHDRGAGGHVIDSACIAIARPGLTYRILSRARGRHDAFYARSAAITDGSTILVACCSSIQERVVRHSSRTNLACTGIAIVRRKIGIVGARRDSTDSIAFRLSTITGGTPINERTGRCILHATRSAHACSRLADRILPLAIRGGIATYAYALAITNQVHIRATGLSCSDVGQRQNTIRARFDGAFEAVIRNILIIRDRSVGSRHAHGLFAVSGHIHFIRSRDPIERRINAKSFDAFLGRARKEIAAFVIGFAGDDRPPGAAHSTGAAHSSGTGFPTRRARSADRGIVIECAAIDLRDQFASGGQGKDRKRHQDAQCTSTLFHDTHFPTSLQQRKPK
jgi:hypothetical protein